jgi:hypothetical protein
MMRRALLALPLLSILVAAPAAHALPLIPEVRPRAGMGINPDQFVVGVQAFLRSRLLGIARLAPSVDVGFGDNVTATLINLDILSGSLTLPGSDLGFYAGAGGSAAIFSSNGNSDTEWGVNIVGGVDFARRFFGEARFGIDKMPDVRLLLGVRLIEK